MGAVLYYPVFLGVNVYTLERVQHSPIRPDNFILPITLRQHHLIFI